MSWRDHTWFLGSTVLTAGHGGIARVARLSARALHSAGANMSLLALADEKPVDIDGLRSVTTRNNRVSYGIRCHLAALTHDHFLYDQLGPARAHPRLPGFRRRYGVWIHGIEVWGVLEPKRMRVLKEADFILVNSHYTLKRFEALHGRLANAHVCPLATEADQPLQPRQKRKGPPTALLIGRTDAESFHKGHTEMVAAWEQVVKTIPDARLLLAGGGTALDHLRSLVQKSPARDNIDVLGFVPESEMPDLWAKADIFALPSRQEGFGLVYIEAMRQGLPVIASVHDAGQEVNLDGVTGYNVSLDHSQELPERLIRLLGDRELSQSMGKAGQSRWFDHFRYSAFKARFMDILDQIEAPHAAQ